MGTVPRVACINDLSGFGRCSLTMALPVLSVMGVQACPVPTAVLSKHTGFSSYSFTDLTDTMDAYLDSWSDLTFDMIYSGFLGSIGQIAVVKRFIQQQRAVNPNCVVLLDTVMGDGGQMYRTYTQELCDAMRELVACADVITPNVTEACLLTGVPYHGECLHTAEALELSQKLKALGCPSVVMTGIVREEMICNLTDTAEGLSFDTVHRTKCLFSGTGDLFASVVCGALASGSVLVEAVQKAGRFLSAVTQYTMQQKTPAAEGVLFEPLLGLLKEEL